MFTYKINLNLNYTCKPGRQKMSNTSRLDVKSTVNFLETRQLTDRDESKCVDYSFSFAELETRRYRWRYLSGRCFCGIRVCSACGEGKIFFFVPFTVLRLTASWRAPQKDECNKKCTLCISWLIDWTYSFSYATTNWCFYCRLRLRAGWNSWTMQWIQKRLLLIINTSLFLWRTLTPLTLYSVCQLLYM